MQKEPTLPELTEWCDRTNQIRVQVEAWRALEKITDQYIERRKDMRMVWNYVRRLGVTAVLRKIHSRLAEQGRNSKVAAIGVGTVVEPDFEESFTEGQKVAFFAPNHLDTSPFICLDTKLVIPWPISPSDSDGEQNETKATKVLSRFTGWSPYSGNQLDGEGIRQGLAAFSARLEQSILQNKDGASNRSRQPEPVQRLKQKQQQPNGKPTAVIFGLGNYAKTQIVPHIQKHLHLSCVHEIDPEQLKAAKSWGVTLDTSPLPRDDETYDAWFMAGFHHTHGPLAVTAIEKGAYAVVEKPLVTTRAQFQDLCNAVESQQVSKLFGCFHKRYPMTLSSSLSPSLSFLSRSRLHWPVPHALLSGKKKKNPKKIVEQRIPP